MKKISPLWQVVSLFCVCLFLTIACEVNRPAEEAPKQAAPAEKKAGPASTQAQPGKMYRIGLVYFAPEEAADTCMKGLFDRMREFGFEEGKNLQIEKTHAAGEISNIPMLFQNLDGQGLNAIVPMTTPCVAAACATVKKTPVVFTYVYDPVAAGAGKSFDDHLPFVTGTSSFPPVEDTVGMIRKVIPGVKTVGTLYNSSEANSRKVISVAREEFTKHAIKLEEVTIASTSEVVQAMQVLASRDIQAFWITGDNTALQAFSGIGKVAGDSKLPLFINDPEFVDKGALMAVGIGWYETGRASASKLARVLNGESPAGIPFESYVVKKLVLNHDVAKKLGIKFSEDVLKQAGQ